jgi:nitrite reductase/ring-hydroxylating ferredoxin subunit
MVSQVTNPDVSGSLCRLEQIPDRGAREARAMVAGDDESLVLLRAGSEVRGFLNICPHAGRPLNWAPGEFLVEGGVLICAAHGASFSVPDGYCVLGPCRGSSLREVALRVVDGEVFVAE